MQINPPTNVTNIIDFARAHEGLDAAGIPGLAEAAAQLKATGFTYLRVNKLTGRVEGESTFPEKFVEMPVGGLDPETLWYYLNDQFIAAPRVDVTAPEEAVAGELFEINVALPDPIDWPLELPEEFVFEIMAAEPVVTKHPRTGEDVPGFQAKIHQQFSQVTAHILAGKGDLLSLKLDLPAGYYGVRIIGPEPWSGNRANIAVAPAPAAPDAHLGFIKTK